MPWKATCPMDEREEFLREWFRGVTPLSRLCRSYGVARKTAYKWRNRLMTEGLSGLKDRSHARHEQERVSEATAEAVIAARTEHPTWGPKKLRVVLERKGEIVVPAASTIGAILRRAGLVKRQAPRRRTRGAAGESVTVSGPNDVWNVDFKGDIRLQNRRRCVPLTVTDTHSRMVLLCAGLSGTGGAATRERFDQLFRERGLPRAIRSDNGQPFASAGAGRLSKLSVWWLRLGVRLIRITAGRPQENGLHERMHRTLKAETAQPPERDMASQQARFDAWMREYNEERPHEALGLTEPARHYTASPRPYPSELPEPEYPSHWETRRVRYRGKLKLGHREFFVSEALEHELVGLLEVEDGVWRMEFCGHAVAEIDLHANRLRPLGGVEGGGSKGKHYK